MNQPNLGTVLVVDDDAVVRETLSRFLTAAGYTVRVVANGREALDLLGASALPDLLVLDLMMPEMTGLELIPTLHSNPEWASLPIIVLTGTKGYTAARLQVDAILMKPFSAIDVQAAVFVAQVAKRARDAVPHA